MRNVTPNGVRANAPVHPSPLTAADIAAAREAAQAGRIEVNQHHPDNWHTLDPIDRPGATYVYERGDGAVLVILPGELDGSEATVAEALGLTAVELLSLPRRVNPRNLACWRKVRDYMRLGRARDRGESFAAAPRALAGGQ